MMNATALVTRGFICPTMGQIVAGLPISPAEGQNLLVRALTLPLPSSMTEAKGIFQTDVIVRTALVMAIADLRANPWLLEHVFASLIDDLATAHAYGEKERRRAIEWFLKTDIPVVMDYYQEQPPATFLSVSLVESSEAEVTLGDVHYQPQEEAEAEWPPLTESFTPEAYHPATGTLQLPTAITDNLVVVEGMVIVDSVGRPHTIESVLHSVVNEKNVVSVVIKPGTVADFTNAVIKGARPRLIKKLESESLREVVRIGVHAHGEPYILTWLHAIVVFILLRYKEVLLEARGFERSSISSTPFAKNEAFGAENLYSRYITLTGYVRHYWPKTANERIHSTAVGLRVNPVDISGGPYSSYSEDEGYVAYDDDGDILDESDDGIGEPMP